VAKARARAAGFLRRDGTVGQHFYTPAKTANWEAYAAGIMLGARTANHPEAGPLKVTILAVFACPKNAAKRRPLLGRLWRVSRPDLDNVAKAVCDAGNAVLWLDDKQIVDLRVQKVIASTLELPRVVVFVEAATPTCI